MAATMSTVSRGSMSAAPASSPSTLSTINTCDTDLLIIHIDVGQGESTLIVYRAFEHREMVPKYTMIIDGGFAAPGRGAIARYLRALNVKTVDAMVCTHFDGDHTKGLTDFIAEHAISQSAATSSSSSSAAGRPREWCKVKTLVVRNSNKTVSKSDTKLRLLNAALNK